MSNCQATASRVWGLRGTIGTTLELARGAFHRSYPSHGVPAAADGQAGLAEPERALGF